MVGEQGRLGSVGGVAVFASESRAAGRWLQSLVVLVPSSRSIGRRLRSSGRPAPTPHKRRESLEPVKRSEIPDAI